MQKLLSKNLLVSTLLLSASVLAPAAFAAGESGPDFSGITAAIAAGGVVAAITAVASVKILPNVARWGYNKIISWIK